ncbi:MAG: hypothetical protein DCC59_09210 [Chloroflexi bacterium]|nr:MAG: hypothetical protein DCC59_09210 [Chloroflexota bacterium]
MRHSKESKSASDKSGALFLFYPWSLSPVFPCFDKLSANPAARCEGILRRKRRREKEDQPV